MAGGLAFFACLRQARHGKQARGLNGNYLFRLSHSVAASACGCAWLRMQRPQPASAWSSLLLISWFSAWTFSLSPSDSSLVARHWCSSVSCACKAAAWAGRAWNNHSQALNGRGTHVYIKRGRRWKIVHEHFSRLP